MIIGLPKKAAKLKSKQRIERNENKENRGKTEISQVVDIPQDIIEEILSRLPVKSILRFKVVSKLWHSTISNPSFQRRCPASMLFGMSFSTSKDRYEFHLIDEEGSVKEFLIPREINKDFIKNAGLSNSCHGMLLLYLGTSDIFLVNPSTHYIDAVLKLEGCFDNHSRTFSMCFCYDESISDYKAVILFSQETVGASGLVASLREKHWTAIHIPSNFHHIVGAPLLNDRLHCTVRVCRHSDDQFGVDNAILYFNPVKDVFEKVCPQPKSGDEDAIIGLGVLEDCLCMARRIGEEESTGDVEFLVMKEYGVAKSWTTLFVLKNLEVNSFANWFDPLLMTNNGDIWIDSPENIYSYNLAKKLCTNLIKKQKSPQLNIVAFVENIFTPNVSSLENHGQRQRGNNIA